MFYTSDVLNNLPIHFDGSDRITTEFFPNSLVRKHEAGTPDAEPKKIEDTST
jgi:hypothetical protein